MGREGLKGMGCSGKNSDLAFGELKPTESVPSGEARPSGERLCHPRPASCSPRMEEKYQDISEGQPSDADTASE